MNAAPAGTIPAEGRVLVITGPNGSTVCTNNRMTGGIIYQGVAA